MSNPMLESTASGFCDGEEGEEFNWIHPSAIRGHEICNR